MMDEFLDTLAIRVAKSGAQAVRRLLEGAKVEDLTAEEHYGLAVGLGVPLEHMQPQPGTPVLHLSMNTVACKIEWNDPELVWGYTLANGELFTNSVNLRTAVAMGYGG